MFQPQVAACTGDECPPQSADEVLDNIPAHRRLRLPMRPDNRSLNLSNAIAVTVFEAWRQLDFAGEAGNPLQVHRRRPDRS